MTDDGRETLARRMAGEGIVGEIDFFAADFYMSLLDERVECYGCEFFDNCGGYFKWPLKEYDCSGVKTVFRTLNNAATELRQDVKGFNEARMEVGR